LVDRNADDGEIVAALRVAVYQSRDLPRNSFDVMYAVADRFEHLQTPSPDGSGEPRRHEPSTAAGMQAITISAIDDLRR
jgi:hypothetical protein